MVFHDDIKQCVNGSLEKYYICVGLAIVPYTWSVKIDTNLSREEMLALEDMYFNCNKGRCYPSL
jgi:hypothetical protein